MKTIDIGVGHSTQKAKPKATTNISPTNPKSEVPPIPTLRKINKKFAQLDQDPDTPAGKSSRQEKKRIQGT